MEPAAALAELNRLFQMGEQVEHYFTVWYGVYRASTRTLRYASAGPARVRPQDRRRRHFLGHRALPPRGNRWECSTTPEFTSASYGGAARCRIPIFSDGAYELALKEGNCCR